MFAFKILYRDLRSHRSPACISFVAETFVSTRSKLKTGLLNYHVVCNLDNSLKCKSVLLVDTREIQCVQGSASQVGAK